MNGCWLSSPLLSGGTIASCCCGRFRGSSIVDVVLQHQDLQLLAVTPDGKLLKLFMQPLLSDARQMRLLPTRKGVDLLAVLLQSGTLALLSYNSDLARFVVVQELTLAYGTSAAGADCLCHHLAVAPEGDCIAVAAARGRIACIIVQEPAVLPALPGAEGAAAAAAAAAATAADSPPVCLSEAVVYAAAEPGVAGAVDLGYGEHLELGDILDMVFLGVSNTQSSSSSSRPVGGRATGVQEVVGDERSLSGDPAATGASHHLAVLSQRANEAASELVLFAWSCHRQQLTKLATVSILHLDSACQVGTPLHLEPVPSSSSAVTVLGSCGLMILDCSHVLQHSQLGSSAAAAAPAVAATVRVVSEHTLFDCHETVQLSSCLSHHLRFAKQVEIPVYVAEALAPDVPSQRLEQQTTDQDDSGCDHLAADLPGDGGYGPAAAAASRARQLGQPQHVPVQLQPDAGWADAAEAAEDLFVEAEDEFVDVERQHQDEDADDFEFAPGSPRGTDDGVEDMSLGTQLQEEIDEQSQEPIAAVSGWAWQQPLLVHSCSGQLDMAQLAAAAADVPVQHLLLTLRTGDIVKLSFAVRPARPPPAPQTAAVDGCSITFIKEEHIYTSSSRSSSRHSSSKSRGKEMLTSLPRGRLLAVVGSQDRALLLGPSCDMQTATRTEAAPAAAAVAARAATGNVLQAQHRSASPAARLSNLHLSTPVCSADGTPTPSSIDNTSDSRAAGAVGRASGVDLIEQGSPWGTGSSRNQTAAAAVDLEHPVGVDHQQDLDQITPVLPDAEAAAAAVAAPAATQGAQKLVVQDSLQLLGQVGPCLLLESHHSLAAAAAGRAGLIGSVDVEDGTTMPTSSSSSTTSCGTPVLLTGDGGVAGGFRAVEPKLPADQLVKGPAGMMEGATGMWPLPVHPGSSSSGNSSSSSNDHRVLVISFASASRALLVGSCFSDVGDVIGLLESEATLLAATVAEYRAVQVTATGVRMCCLDLISSGSGEHNNSSGSDGSCGRQWRNNPKTTRSSSVGGGGSSSSRPQQGHVHNVLPCWRHSAAAAAVRDDVRGAQSLLGHVQLPPAAATASHAGFSDSTFWTVQQYKRCWQGESGGLTATAAAAAAVVVLAAAAPGIVLLHLSTGDLVFLQVSNTLEPATAAATAAGLGRDPVLPLVPASAAAPAGSAAAAAAATGIGHLPYPSGKKRPRDRWCLVQAGQFHVGSQVSCVQIFPAASSAAAAAGGSRLSEHIVVVGSYDGSLQLLTAKAGGSIIEPLWHCSTDQLHPLQVLSKVTSNCPVTALSPQVATAAPAVPDNCIVLPGIRSGAALSACTVAAAAGGGTATSDIGTSMPGRSCRAAAADAMGWLLLVSYRNGDIALYEVNTAVLLLRRQQQQQQQQPRLAFPPAAAAGSGWRVLAQVSLPGAPAKLQLLHPTTLPESSTATAALAPQLMSQQHVLAVSDCVWLLRVCRQPCKVSVQQVDAPHFGVAVALKLPLHSQLLQCQSGSCESTQAATSKQAAAPAAAAASSKGSNCEPHWQLLACVTLEGQLQLLGLQQQLLRQQQQCTVHLRGTDLHNLDLLQHPPTGKLLSRCIATPQSPYAFLQLLDAETGEVLAAHLPHHPYSVTCLALWGADGRAFATAATTGATSSEGNHDRSRFAAAESCQLAGAAVGAGRALRGTAQSAQCDGSWLPEAQADTLPRVETAAAAAGGARSPAVVNASRPSPKLLSSHKFKQLVVLGTEALHTDGCQENNCQGQLLVLQLAGQWQPAAAEASRVLPVLHPEAAPPDAAVDIAGHLSGGSAGQAAVGAAVSSAAGGGGGMLAEEESGPHIMAQYSLSAFDFLFDRKDQQNSCHDMAEAPNMCSQQHLAELLHDDQQQAWAKQAAADGTIKAFSFKKLARLRLPSAVNAVAGFGSQLLLVAMNDILAVYRLCPLRGKLQQAGHCPVRAPITSLAVIGEIDDRGGMVLAGDLFQGLAMFKIEIQPVTERVGLSAIAAHGEVRRVMQVACLPPMARKHKLPSRGSCGVGPTGRDSGSRGTAAAGNTAAATTAAAAAGGGGGVMRALCLDREGQVVEVSWTRHRHVPQRCLTTVASVPLWGQAVSLYVPGDGSSSSSGDHTWARSSGQLSGSGLPLHWQMPVGSSAAGAAGLPWAVVTSSSCAVLHLQWLPAFEGMLLQQLQWVLLQHPATARLCIGGQQLLPQLGKQQGLAVPWGSGPSPAMAAAGSAVVQPGRPQAVDVSQAGHLGAALQCVDARVLKQLLVLPRDQQVAVLQDAGFGRLLQHRLIAAGVGFPKAQSQQGQQLLLDAVLCRLQLLPSWD